MNNYKFDRNCSKCKGELKFAPFGITLDSMPPSYSVVCKNCGNETMAQLLTDVEEFNKKIFK